MSPRASPEGRGSRLFAEFERQLWIALKAAGRALHHGDGAVRVWVSMGPRRHPVVLRVAREARREGLQALLADAILRGRASSRGPFVAMVGAPAISPGMEEALEAYVAGVAPGQPFGYVDARGLVRIKGLGLDGVRGEQPRRVATQALRPRDLFSDLNQWLLKVLLGRALPPALLSVPRAQARSAAGLAALAHVSTPTAWRLSSALEAERYLDEAGEPVLVGELLDRWRAAVRRPQRRVGARWILPGRAPLGRLRGALAELEAGASQPSACLGSFAACEALGFGTPEVCPSASTCGACPGSRRGVRPTM